MASLRSVLRPRNEAQGLRRPGFSPVLKRTVIPPPSPWLAGLLPDLGFPVWPSPTDPHLGPASVYLQLIAAQAPGDPVQRGSCLAALLLWLHKPRTLFLPAPWSFPPHPGRHPPVPVTPLTSGPASGSFGHCPRLLLSPFQFCPIPSSSRSTQRAPGAGRWA